MPKQPYLARLLDLSTLEQLRREINRLGADKGGIPIMAGKGILRTILLEQIPTAAANCIKQEILARGGELVTPASAAGFEEPFVDVIAIGSITTFRSLISKLYRQTAFDMPALADIMQNLLVRTTPGYLPVSPRPSRQGVMVEETLEDLMGGRIPLQPGSNRATGTPVLAPVPGHGWRFGQQTYLMATVSGLQSKAWQRVQAHAEAGASMINLLCEPSADGAPSAAVPLVERVRQHYPDLIIAVTTAESALADQLVRAGAQLIQAQGDWDPDLYLVAARAGLPVILTHSRPIPGDSDTLSPIARFFYEGLETLNSLGIGEDQVILNPGVGPGKTWLQNLEVTRRLRELTGFGRPLLYTPPPLEEPSGRAAALVMAVAGGAHIVMVEDAAEMAPCISMTDLLVHNRE